MTTEGDLFLERYKQGLKDDPIIARMRQAVDEVMKRRRLRVIINDPYNLNTVPMWVEYHQICLN